MDEEKEIVVLTGEDEKEHSFSQLALINLDGGSYLILQPLEEPSFEEDEVLIFEISEEKVGESSYRIVEDELLQQRVLEEYEALL